MRSHLIYGALAPVQNRYLLCQLASKATRKFHRPATRVQDTMNDVFAKFSKADDAEKVMAIANSVAEPHQQAA